MGLLGALFGGGTKVEIKLDANEIAEGGILSGTATLHGGKKPLTLTTLKVRLIYVHVEQQEDSPLPNIDTRILVDEVIAEGQDLPPESEFTYDFQFAVPPGTEPTAHNVSYKVQVVGDIPKVADPSADVELKVAAAQATSFLGFAKGAQAMNANELLLRYPDLQSDDEEALLEAMRELMLDAYDDDKNLVAAEPILTRHIRTGNVEVRKGALEAWGNVLNGKARPENLQLLHELAHDEMTPAGLIPEIIKTAAKFAEEGAFGLVQEYAQNADAEIRREVAEHLYFDADREVPGRRQLLLQMSNDEDATVRAAVFRAFAMFTSDETIMQLVAERAKNDPSAEVQRACIGAIQLAHYTMKDLVFDTYGTALQNPNSSVRKQLTESVHWLPEDQRLEAIVSALLQDGDDEVRKSMAWQFRNLSRHPELLPLVKSSAENDQNDKVRGEALAGLGAVMPVEDLVPYYRARMAQEPTKEVLWGVYEGVRDHQRDDENAKQLLVELSQCDIEDVAESARSWLGDY